MNASVDATKLRRAIARTPLAPVAAFPKRLARVARHDAKVLGASARWLVTSREHHNYTYDLTPLSRDHLAWFVSVTCDVPVARSAATSPRSRPTTRCAGTSSGPPPASARRGLADRRVRYARRIGWYAIVRARRPAHVVETGVDKGLGTLRARRPPCCATPPRGTRAGSPRWTSTRRPATSPGPRRGRDVVDLVIGDSIASIGALDRPVDLFLHDSDHSRAHEQREFDAVEPKLAPGAMLLTDNVTITDVLRRARRDAPAGGSSPTGRPRLDHWYPGDGIGVAW